MCEALLLLLRKANGTEWRIVKLKQQWNVKEMLNKVSQTCDVFEDVLVWRGKHEKTSRLFYDAIVVDAVDRRCRWRGGRRSCSKLFVWRRRRQTVLLVQDVDVAKRNDVDDAVGDESKVTKRHCRNKIKSTPTLLSHQCSMTFSWTQWQALMDAKRI